MKIPEIIVQGVGYSHHTKPYASSVRNHLDRYLLRLQVQGVCRAILDGEDHLIRPGDLILSPPGGGYVLHVEEACSADPVSGCIDSGDYHLNCRGEWMRQWWSRSSRSTIVRVPLDEGLLSTWRKLILEKRNLSDGNEELQDYLVRVLCLSLDRLIQVEQRQLARGGSHVAYAIKRYVEQHATDALTLERIARALGVSISGACHHFKLAFGQSIMHYVVEVRLAIAAERIASSGASLEEVARAAGFRSYPYFSRAFRRRFGLAPSQYRDSEPAAAPARFGG
ncbi:helix-turn-helix transcriptional regulator [Paenibacillus sp. IB182496]|uniref:Helix-turn-helix transcriptional regulator n=1 Tax=Paenibacillus sabuli TaxID=2772509 RepID=A0A927GSE0_9BACL|nr:AraC family transcriptional regulator [Paenibacillus sabuli]MBD2845612.1 helix-turn-helix transcriptional regulator [Paenibacillus sabuli]